MFSMQFLRIIAWMFVIFLSMPYAPVRAFQGIGLSMPRAQLPRSHRRSAGGWKMHYVSVDLKEADVAEGQSKVVTARNIKLVVTKKEGKLFAFNNKCPHLGLSLKRGQITGSDDRHGICVVCPFHKSKFSLEENGKCKVWSESVFGIKGTESIGNKIGQIVAPMAKSVNPTGEKAAPAAVYGVKIEDGEILVDLPPDLSKYAQTRQYIGYKEYAELPENTPRRPVDPRR
mmetsp:Transcript_5654/g.13135  ORF Transcript_5654/g.13135 Transcript_5654/m.13135 type:complete len:229 (-) Transcript_5654:1751-2437(-)